MREVIDRDYEYRKIVYTLKKESLGFLELSGRKTMYTQNIYGQDIIVAVIDTGVSKHIEFEDRLLDGYNLSSSYSEDYKSSNYSWKDDNGHGTHVAATIAGVNCGIAPRCKILPIKVLDNKGACSDLNNIIKSFEIARKWTGNNGEKVSIISVSLSFPKELADSSIIEKLHDEIKSCVNENIAVICSAGNTSNFEEYRYPAMFDEVICVGAVDVNKKIAYFSSKGSYVDVCQIGVDVLSAYYKGGYKLLSGTSMSTPIVSGIAALLASKYKNQRGKDIIERKLYESVKLNTKDIGIKGVDKLYGAGFCTLQPLDVNIKMKIGSKIVEVNGNKMVLDTEPILYKKRFYMSLRHMSDIFGFNVVWNKDTKIAEFKS